MQRSLSQNINSLGTVLITGASGFVGSRLTCQLRASGIKVRTIGRTRDNFRPNITRDDIFSLGHDAWCEILEDVDTVIHSAWYVVHSDYLISEKNIECEIGTKRLADACIDSGVKHFVGIGTCLEYSPANVPHEASDPLAGSSPYVEAKINTFNYLSRESDCHDMLFTWPRIFHVYGDGEPITKLYSYAKTQINRNECVVVRDTESCFDFIPIDEAVRQIITATILGLNGAVNICSGVGQTIPQFCESIGQSLNKTVTLAYEVEPNRTPNKILGIPHPKLISPLKV